MWRDEGRRPVVRRADVAFTFSAPKADFAHHAKRERTTARGRASRDEHQLHHSDPTKPPDVRIGTPSRAVLPRGLEPILVPRAYAGDRTRSRLALSVDPSRLDDAPLFARRSTAGESDRLFPAWPASVSSTPARWQSSSLVVVRRFNNQVVSSWAATTRAVDPSLSTLSTRCGMPTPTSACSAIPARERPTCFRRS